MPEQAPDWRCRMGRHHYADVPDDNPETRGRSHSECTRCGQIRDKNEYLPGNPGLGGS